METNTSESSAPEHGKTGSADTDSGMSLSKHDMQRKMLILGIAMETGARKRAREALTGSEPTTPSVRCASA